MEIRQLEIFACLAKTLNFTKAAESMYISQPTVSSCINALEKTLNSQLLIRNTKEVSLTKAGVEFLGYAQKILSLRDQALYSMSGDRSANGTIDIISSTIPGQHLLPDIIASFQKQWPNIVFRVDQADSQQVELKMEGFQYDFGMVGTIPDVDRFIHYPVYDDELVLAIPNDASQDPKAIQAGFADYITRVPFIMREPGSGTRSEIEALLSKIGIDARNLRIPAYFSDAHGILRAVSRGIGVSLVSKAAASMYVEVGLLKIVDMNDPLFHRQIHLLYNKEIWLSPLQQDFADHARNFYRNGGNREDT